MLMMTIRVTHDMSLVSSVKTWSAIEPAFVPSGKWITASAAVVLD